MLAAGRVRSKEKKRKKKHTHTQKNPLPPPKTHHEIHNSPATASNLRRHARKHVTHVRQYSPASIDPGFVEIGLVQISQKVKTTDVTHTDRHRQTAYIMAPCTHPGMKGLFLLKAKNCLGRFAPSSLLHDEGAFLLKAK